MRRQGWTVERQKGSRRVLRHLDGRRLVVAFHGRIRRNALRNTLGLAGIAEQDFLEAL